MDHITNNTSLIGPSDVIPVGAQNPRFPVVGHRFDQSFLLHRHYLFYINALILHFCESRIN